jgi:hypothetical protein
LSPQPRAGLPAEDDSELSPQGRAGLRRSKVPGSHASDLRPPEEPSRPPIRPYRPPIRPRPRPR